MSDDTSALLAIRADASERIGSGHVMRMLALAQAWRARGGEVVMVCLHCLPAVQTRLESESISLVPLSASTAGGKEDAAATAAVARSRNAQWLVVDGYCFGLEYQRSVRQAGLKLMVLDDYGYSDSWCAEVILNQNLGAERRVYHNEVATAKHLLGASYVLLRREFQLAVPVKPASLDSRGHTVLVTFGGVDITNFTLKVLTVLAELKAAQMRVIALVGGGNPHLAALEAFVATHEHFEIATNVTDMPQLYRRVDSVISAAGSSCYEWLRFGLPGAVVTLAENQRPVAQALVEHDMASHLGWHEALTPELLTQRLKCWLEGLANRRDPEGAKISPWGSFKVVSQLQGDCFFLRPVCSEDLLDYYELANDPSVRGNSLNTSDIKLEDHQRWFQRHLDNPDSLFLTIVHLDGAFIGQVRFERKAPPQPTWTISFSLRSRFRGMGIGKRALAQGIAYLQAQLSARATVLGIVKRGNPASQKVFEKLGFLCQNETSEHFVFTKELTVKTHL